MSGAEEKTTAEKVDCKELEEKMNACLKKQSKESCETFVKDFQENCKTKEKKGWFSMFQSSPEKKNVKESVNV